MGLFGAVGGIGKSFAAGFNFVDDIGTFKNPLSALSIGSAGTALTMAGAGAVVGAGIGVTRNTEDPGKTAAVGAGIGAATGALAIPAAGAAVGAVYGTGRMAVKAATSGVARKAGAGILSGIGGIGSAIYSGATGSILPGQGIGSRVVSSMANPVGRYAGAAKNTLSKFATFTEKNHLMPNAKSGFKLTGLGATVIAGGAIVGAVKRGVDTSNTIRQGQRDGMVHTATPRTPSYANNAGATGDLAFALHANRRG